MNTPLNESSSPDETTQASFENQWWYKVVVPRMGGKLDGLPVKRYLITAALWQYNEDKSTILALYAFDYSLENKHWFTIHVKPEDMEATLGSLEVIDTPEARNVAARFKAMNDQAIEEMRKEKGLS